MAKKPNPFAKFENSKADKAEDKKGAKKGFVPFGKKGAKKK
jgi:hypothetical protein